LTRSQKKVTAAAAKPWPWVITALGIAASIVLISGRCAAASNTTLVVAEGSHSFTVMPVYIAIDKGYFDKVGLTVKLVTMKGGPAAVAALLGGDVDAAVTAAETAVRLRGQGKHLLIAAVIQDHNPCVLVVPTSSTAASLNDLKAKSIGVTATGSLSDSVLREYLQKLGLSADAFEIVGLGSGATVAAALEHGQIQAAMTFNPFLTELMAAHQVRIVHDFRQEVYPGQSVLVLESDDKGPKHLALMNFVAALRKGAEALYKDPDLVRATALKYFPEMDPQIIDSMIREETRTIPLFSADLKLSRADYAVLVDILLRTNSIPHSEKYEDIVATDLWQ
jgi:NitT/TauT family transport system substrate-binding protein